jgi:hypothetical protein
MVCLVAAVGCGREHMLPRPDPLPAHRSSGLSAQEQRRLADVRRFVDPREQALIERSLEDLARDPRMPQPEVEQALRGAVSRLGSAADFCERLARELEPLTLRGAEAPAPDVLAIVASIETVHASWLSAAGRSRHGEPRVLARAIRDGTLEPDALDRGFVLRSGPGVLFVTDAAVFDQPGPSAAGRVCLAGPPAASFVIARIPKSALAAPLRVPTAADGACRPNFVLRGADAPRGETCAGAPEFVTQPVPLASVSELRLSY